MSTDQVTVIVQLKVRPGMEEVLKEEFQTISYLTRSENGCISYDLHQDVENSLLFCLYENWVSRELLDQHLQMPYVRALAAKAGDILAEPMQVNFMKKIS